MGNLIQYIAQEDPEKSMSWQTPIQRNNRCKRRTSLFEKTEYTNPNPRRIPDREIFKSGLEGFGQGIENGSLSLFNTKTGGLYDLASYLFMKDDYGKRQEKMQKEAENVGLGALNKLANYAIDVGGGRKILNGITSIGIKRTKQR